MNTTDVFVLTVAGLSGGGFVAGAMILRPAVADLAWSLRDAMSKGYTASAALSFKPPATPRAVPAADRVPESRAERPAPAVIPEGEYMTRQQAAGFLGIPVTTLKSNEGNWGIERSGIPGPRGSVMLTAASVSRALASRNGSSRESEASR